MKPLTVALLGAGGLVLAASVAAEAASPDCVAASAPLLVLAAPSPMLPPDISRIETVFAAEEAQLDRMMREMMQAGAHTPAIALTPGTQVFSVALSNGGGASCSEVITRTIGADGKPHVSVQRSGNACGNLRPSLPSGLSTPYQDDATARVQQVRQPLPPARWNGPAYRG